MKVKKYVVDTLPQAMGQIKSELGNDALILHTKKIKQGGFFGLFGKEKIEVIAAVDPNKKISKNNPTKSMNNPVYSHSNQSSNINQQQAQNTNVEATFEQQNKEYRSSQSSINNNNAQNHEDKLLSSEVSELKRMMVKLMMNQTDNKHHSSYSKDLNEIFEQLLKQGVKEEVAASIIQGIVEATSSEEGNQHDIKEVARKQIIKTLEKNSTIKEVNSNTCIIHFVGPTGVGKTTTIAKLAADKVIKENKKVAFITADTYRIGAVDQLRIYAEILHAPIEIVNSPQATMKAIDKLKSYDYIFMDTAGRNYHNEMYISELNNVLSKTNISETYLVLSLTHKYEDMVSILEQFKEVEIDKVLFTKFDETFTYGSILNILSLFPYQASYVTYGQNVPEDIELFDSEKIAGSILGV